MHYYFVKSLSNLFGYCIFLWFAKINAGPPKEKHIGGLNVRQCAKYYFEDWKHPLRLPNFICSGSQIPCCHVTARNDVAHSVNNTWMSRHIAPRRVKCKKRLQGHKSATSHVRINFLVLIHFAKWATLAALKKRTFWHEFYQSDQKPQFLGFHGKWLIHL